jgi:hypothetical protein
MSIFAAIVISIPIGMTFAIEKMQLRASCLPLDYLQFANPFSHRREIVYTGIAVI